MIPWEHRFYDPDLFDASAGDADDPRIVERYIDALPTAPATIMDIGAGTGRLTLRLLSEGYRVVAIEMSPAMLRRLRDKVASLVPDASVRLISLEGDVLTVEPPVEVDAAIAADDFLTHFLDPCDLGRFFDRVVRWVKPIGKVLTDLRGISCSRLQQASMPPPKPLLSFGLSSLGDEHESQWVASRAWEEYENSSRVLISHQAFDFIAPDGQVMKTVYKTIRQRRYGVEEVTQIAKDHGFEVVSVRDRYDSGELEEESQGAFLVLQHIA